MEILTQEKFEAICAEPKTWNKRQTNEYWSLKNRIGYCVLTGNNAKRKALEQVLSNLMKKAGK